jgi:thiol:disulfide interchange protein
MKRIFFIVVTIVITCNYLNAQAKLETGTDSKFDATANPFADLNKVMTEAKKLNKRILLDVGGEWCIWCHRIDQFIDQHEEINKFLHQNFVVLKINYSKENKNEKFLAQYPKISGFPHFFVLAKNGKLLHSQDTGKLEKDKSYDEEKMMNFLKEWAPKKE